MSKISLSPSPTGSAVYTIASPAGSTDRTLTLPDTTAPILAGSGITLSASAPSNTLVTTGAGNVGIGTSLPTSKLTIQEPDTPTLRIFASNNTSGDVPRLEFIRGTDGAFGSASRVGYRFEVAAGVFTVFSGQNSVVSPVQSFDSAGNFSSVSPGGTTLLPEFKCRAWVNFNGQGTVAIRASGNVSSITDNGTGNYTVNFTTAMPDADYSPVVTAGVEAATLGITSTSTTVPTSSAYRFRTTDAAANAQDSARVHVAIFR